MEYIPQLLENVVGVMEFIPHLLQHSAFGSPNNWCMDYNIFSFFYDDESKYNKTNNNVNKLNNNKHDSI